ncbi:phospholipase D family protein [Pseudomonas capeferrum]|uniref:phospholipase D family protein n=1 Tax=Pseudomonas capeferrum TaxID=1495066 RepID=UPI0015E31F23|nr:phospholipase D family protein [Pseudomonas capeferrum]MBA1204406.1 phospholipase D family protein [Pseudomonas capeferrum]
MFSLHPLCTLILGISLLSGCSLPPLEGRMNSRALPQAQAELTTLGRAIAQQTSAEPDKNKSGIVPLADPHDAFAARILLARMAEKTLDVQYYIWHGDITGTLLFEALREAADRGVKVRLLLDDNGTTGLDIELAALDTHPNIEVRLFNPFIVRSPKALGYVTAFSRANRRMHNKSFTADNQATIVGGRNVGDEYFGATDGVLFADLDVFAIGPIVQSVSSDFDKYWASDSAYPADRILPAVKPSRMIEITAAAASLEQSPAAQQYISAIRESSFMTGLLQNTLTFEWAPVRMVSDDPAKGLGDVETSGLLITQLNDILGKPVHTLDLVSPYFVPTAAGVDTFTQIANSGVRLRVLTNALEATDVVAVHAGYAKRRKDLLKAGVVLYEMRSTAYNGQRNESAGLFGSSGSSLHAKTFGVDHTRTFVGSFNFDPRSAHLNTELGFIIENPKTAEKIDEAFTTSIPEHAYEVRLTDDDQLYWLEIRDGVQVRHDREPGATFFQRIAVSILSILPIEWLL